MTHPDIRDKKQVTVKVTEQFAKDLNVLLAHYGDRDVSYVLRRTIELHAGYLRKRWAAERAASQGSTAEM
jgi:hypothetical protein